MRPEVVKLVDGDLHLFFQLFLFVSQLVFQGLDLRLDGRALDGRFRLSSQALDVNLSASVAGRLVQLFELLAQRSQRLLGGFSPLLYFKLKPQLCFLYGIVSHILVYGHNDMLGEVKDSLQVPGR